MMADFKSLVTKTLNMQNQCSSFSSSDDVRGLQMTRKIHLVNSCL